MKYCIISAILGMAVVISCATMSGKWNASRLDTLAERCTEENQAGMPSTSRWHNLSTQERREKKNELADFRKKRIHLYQVLHDFKEIYMTHVDDDGRCQRKECAPLAKLRVTIVEGCPVAGESFPLFAAE